MYLQVKGVVKSYESGGDTIQVLKAIDIEVEQGQMCAIFGPSGSGKSTVLNVVGGLDNIDNGSIFLAEQDISRFSVKQLSLYRRNSLGFIFQFYNLIPDLTVRENIETCSYLSKSPLDVDELVSILDLKLHQDKFPAQLSGGQQQRCAIGRALAKNPDLLLCDEPTGALDYKSAKDILYLLEKVNSQYGTTMLIVSHNYAIRDMVHKWYQLKDGSIHESVVNKNRKQAIDIDW